MKLRRFSGLLALVFCAFAGGATAAVAAAPTTRDRQAFESVLEDLEMWDLEGATAALEELRATAGDSEIVRELEGRVLFFRGDYAGAAERLRGSDGPYAALAAATLVETKDYVEAQSEHFALRYPAGKDAILVPYALETLERARTQIGHDLGILPEERIRVEILRDTAALSKLSPLTEVEIETSGTIALCKYNKLMVVSPRALLTGYTWQDTLAHELTHYLITRRSKNKTPIWIHEGIAKFEESRWRGAAGQALSPATSALLSRRLQKGTLISFERMHPSIARLPSQEDAALAFAEVFTFMEYLVRERGAALEKILEGLAAGKDDAQAVAAAAGEPFDQVALAWKAYLRRRPMPSEVLPLSPEKLKFRDPLADKRPRAGEPDLGELQEIEDRVARRYAHLGSLLLQRSRNTAALGELAKAEARVGARSPMLSNLYARALVGEGRLPQAEVVLRASLVPYPEIARTHLRLADVLEAGKRWDEAGQELLAANAVDPFDPSIHAGLARVAKEKGDAAGETRELQAAHKLLEPE